MSLHGCEVGGQERRLTFIFFDICPGIFVLFEWMEYSELQGNTNVDILHPKVKVKFLSRLGD